jgi:hypothetical protein
LDRLEAHAVVEQRVRMARAIAGGDDARLRCQCMRVEENAIVSWQSRGRGELDVGHDADADDR